MIAPWLTLEGFMDASGWSRGHVFRQQKRGKLITMKVGRATHYASESLPQDALAKLETLSKPTKEKRPAELACAPAPLFAAVATQGPGRRIALTPEVERQAMQRLHVLQPLLDFCAADKDGRAKYSALRYTGKTGEQLPVRTSNDLALYLCQTNTAAKASPSTLWDWKKKYEADGLVGLARKVREDKGQSKWATQWPEASKLVAATFLQAEATRQRAYDALVRDAARLGMTPADVPSYASVCDFLGSLPAAPVVFAREGERAHDERFATYLRRDYYDIKPFQIVVSDHMIHDIEVRNDCFFGVPEGAPMRLRLTMLMDLRSRKALTYTWTPEGSSRSISSALRAMAQEYGVPQTFYCDNGRDYQKIGRGAQAANAGRFIRPDGLDRMVDEDMTAIERAGVLRQLGIAVQYCIKYHPQSKPIERMFRTFHLGLDAIMPHYLTGSTATRPEKANIAGAEHRKLLRMGRAHQSELIPASHFIAMAKDWIENDYNAKRRVKGRGMDGLTPNEVFANGYSAENRRMVDQSILDQLLWQREKRQVRNCSVTINNRRLIGTTPRDAEVLYLASKSGDDGTNVIVCFDPNAPDTGVVIDEDGHKLCDVRAEVFAPHSAEAGPMIAAEIQGRRGRRNDTAASIRALQKSVVRSGHQTDASLLYERAMLPMAVNDSITQRIITPAPKPVAAPRYAHEIAADMLREG